MNEVLRESMKQPVFWLFIVIIVSSAIAIIWFQTKKGKRWLNDVK